MSTGRGVTDVKIYTPAAVLERFGVTPAQIPDYIGLKGDSSDNIPGVPGVGEKTAAQLLQQFGSIDELYARLDEVKSEKRRALLEEHEQDARLSLQLATMVLDVPLEHDLVELVTTLRLPPAGARASTPSSSASSSTTCAAASRRSRGRRPSRRRPPPRPPSPAGSCAWRPSPDVGPVAALLEKGEAALAFEPRGDGDGLAVASHAGGDVCLVAPGDAGRVGLALAAGRPRRRARRQVASPASCSAPVGPAFDTAVAAYLLAPERPERERTLFALAGADDGAQLVEAPAAEAAAATRATLTWRVAEAQRPRLIELGLERLFREVELPLVRVLAADGGRRRQDGPVPARRDHGARARPHRRARRRDHPPGRRPVHHRLAAAAGRGAVRAPRPRHGAEGQDRVLHRRPRAARPARPARDRPGGRGVAGAHQAAQHLPRAAPGPPRPGHRPAPHDLQPAGGRHRPALAARTRTCRTSRCAPSWAAEIRSCFVAEEGCRLARRRLLPDRAAPHGVALRRAGAARRATTAARTSTASPPPRSPASPSKRSPRSSASAPRRPTSASCTGSRPSASRSRSTCPWRRRAPSSTRTSPSTRT